MEEFQWAHIRANLPYLLETTICTDMFLAHFYSAGLLSHSDMDVLKNIPDQHEKTLTFYEFIKTRSHSFDLLKQALLATAQSGAHKIINNCQLSSIGAIDYFRASIIGRGQFGTIVFRGRFDSLDVAVKIITLDFNELASVRKEVEFLRRQLGSRNHDNIVRYYKTEETNDSVLIALELCDTNLHDWVVNKGQGIDMDVEDVLVQGTTGIGYLHSTGILHRDLKPANLLLLKTEDGRRLVKISDFGMSRKVPNMQSGPMSHSSGLGTEGWRSPEVLRYMQGKEQQKEINENIGYPSDIFSLGCIFYFVLSRGIHPFGDSIVRQSNILTGTADLTEEEITAVDAGLPGYIALIRDMIAPEPVQRPTASQVITSLSSVSTGDDPAGGRSDSPFPQASISQDLNDKVDKDGNTKLHLAAHKPDESLVRKLVGLGADLNIRNRCRRTPLHLAAKGRDKTVSLRIIKFLVQSGADVYVENDCQDTFLHTLVRNGLTPEQFHEISVFLVEHEFAGMFSIPGNFSNTPFYWAIRTFEIGLPTLELLHRNGVEFNWPNRRGHTAIFHAVILRRSPEFIGKLAELGADCGWVNHERQNLLHIAIMAGLVEVLGLLLGLGVDPDHGDKNGNSPLHYVLGYYYRKDISYEMARLLVENGADVRKEDCGGKTALDMALKLSPLVKDKEKLVQLLKSKEE